MLYHWSMSVNVFLRVQSNKFKKIVCLIKSEIGKGESYAVQQHNKSLNKP